MSLYGLTKGTPLEKAVAALAQGEANGVMMYYALARMAKELGLDEEISKTLIESANQEAVHAGFYATLNGKYPKENFWALLETVKNAEINGEKQIKDLADKVRAAGFNEAADEMEIFAKQEEHHGVVIEEIFKKYNPPKVDNSGKKIYVRQFQKLRSNSPLPKLFSTRQNIFLQKNNGLSISATRIFNRK